uniref:Secreted protein n=1 Tax=Physcomitrium patens TaxID=3218 RepID=A0A7I3ZF82_PHYPA
MIDGLLVRFLLFFFSYFSHPPLGHVTVFYGLDLLLPNIASGEDEIKHCNHICLQYDYNPPPCAYPSA